MANWFLKRFGKTRRTADEIVRDLDELLLAPWSESSSPRWVALVGELCQADIGAFREREEQLRQRMERWYEENPIQPRWGAGLDVPIDYPLAVTSDAFVRSEDDPVVPEAWTSLLRSFVVCDGGPNALRHGYDPTHILSLLEQLSPVARIEHLPLGDFVDYPAADVHALLSFLCEDARVSQLKHLRLPSHGIEATHIESLAKASWARTLESLDLTEVMVAWGADLEPAERRGPLQSIGAFQGLRRLMMYNNVFDRTDLEALLSQGWAELEYLNLGSVSGVALGDHKAFLRLLCDRDRLPKLRKMYLELDGASRDDWDCIAGSSVECLGQG